MVSICCDAYMQITLVDFLLEGYAYDFLLFFGAEWQLAGDTGEYT